MGQAVTLLHHPPVLKSSHEKIPNNYYLALAPTQIPSILWVECTKTFTFCLRRREFLRALATPSNPKLRQCKICISAHAKRHNIRSKRPSGPSFSGELLTILHDLQAKGAKLLVPQNQPTTIQIRWRFLKLPKWKPFSKHIVVAFMVYMHLKL